jgi:hypothetical protein
VRVNNAKKQMWMEAVAKGYAEIYITDEQVPQFRWKK